MARNYHTCLSVILQSFKSNQGKNVPIHGYICIGNHVAQCRLFFPLAFVIGDGLSGDQLCGRYKNYSPRVAWLSHACNVSFDNSDDPHWKCNYLKMSKLQQLWIRGLKLNGFIGNDAVENMPVGKQRINVFFPVYRRSHIICTIIHLKEFGLVITILVFLVHFPLIWCTLFTWHHSIYNQNYCGSTNPKGKTWVGHVGRHNTGSCSLRGAE